MTGCGAKYKCNMRRTGVALRRKMWWQHKKMWLIIIIVVLILVLVIFLSICLGGGANCFKNK